MVLVDNVELMTGLVVVVVKEEVRLMELVVLVEFMLMAKMAVAMALVAEVLDLEIGLVLTTGLVV